MSSVSSSSAFLGAIYSYLMSMGVCIGLVGAAPILTINENGGDKTGGGSSLDI